LLGLIQVLTLEAPLSRTLQTLSRTLQNAKICKKAGNYRKREKGKEQEEGEKEKEKKDERLPRILAFLCKDS